MILSWITWIIVNLIEVLIWIKLRGLWIKEGRWNIIDVYVLILVKGVIILQDSEEVSFTKTNWHKIILLRRVINSVAFLVLLNHSSALNLTSYSCSFVVLYLAASNFSIRRIFELHNLFIFKFKWIPYCDCFIHFF